MTTKKSRAAGASKKRASKKATNKRTQTQAKQAAKRVTKSTRRAGKRVVAATKASVSVLRKRAQPITSPPNSKQGETITCIKCGHQAQQAGAKPPIKCSRCGSAGWWEPATRGPRVQASIDRYARVHGMKSHEVARKFGIQ